MWNTSLLQYYWLHRARTKVLRRKIQAAWIYHKRLDADAEAGEMQRPNKTTRISRWNSFTFPRVSSGDQESSPAKAFLSSCLLLPENMLGSTPGGIGNPPCGAIGIETPSLICMTVGTTHITNLWPSADTEACILSEWYRQGLELLRVMVMNKCMNAAT